MLLDVAASKDWQVLTLQFIQHQQVKDNTSDDNYCYLGSKSIESMCRTHQKECFLPDLNFQASTWDCTLLMSYGNSIAREHVIFKLEYRKFIANGCSIMHCIIDVIFACGMKISSWQLSFRQDALASGIYFHWNCKESTTHQIVSSYLLYS